MGIDESGVRDVVAKVHDGHLIGGSLEHGVARS
jgi:hypothetical protein